MAIAKGPRGGGVRDAGAAAHTRREILDAAERLFSFHGVTGVAVRDLARELGLTPSSLYNHFPSKRALYAAVLERGMAPIAALISAAWRPGPLERTRVRDTVDGVVAHLAGHPHLARLLQRALLEESDEIRAMIVRWVAPLYASGRKIIGEAGAAADWDPAEIPHLALGLYGMVFAYFTNATMLSALAVAEGDPMAPEALDIQRRFLEEGIYRLLGPRQKESAGCAVPP